MGNVRDDIVLLSTTGLLSSASKQNHGKVCIYLELSDIHVRYALYFAGGGSHRTVGGMADQRHFQANA